jgi:PIN domain nuclease of toxin-antitoxin system
MANDLLFHQPGYLLDTHVLLWWLTGDPRLNQNRENRLQHTHCLVSAASIWEAAIKHRLGKLPLAPSRLFATAQLSPIHKDLFDRLLIAQARWEGLHFLTADRTLLAYGKALDVL